MTKAKIEPPTKKALMDALDSAGSSVQGAEYLATQFKKILIAAKKLEEFGDVLQKVEDFVKYTKFKLLSSSQPWLGQSVATSGFQNMQANMASEAINDLKNMNIGPEKEVGFHFAISDKSEFLRGYTSEGKALDAKSVESLDKLYNAWLAKNDIVSKDGILYQANKNGDIIKEANPSDVKNLIDHSEDGLAKYLDKEAGIKLTSHSQKYPTQQAEVTVKSAAKTAIEERFETEEAQQPSQTGGM
jgi:hypothetical protein